MAPSGERSQEAEFDDFVREAERRLSFAYAAAYGPDLGAEATAEAIAYAWEHRDRLNEMANPFGVPVQGRSVEGQEIPLSQASDCTGP